ncbi:hypothetical protein RFI_18827 [Reticulomyxa filosa]|uniref:Uncharacterized protein n=1 Tax=Reticulomyxa filosa TaxID=46433 RepID=X6MWR4_RETFI|nr:hypothetical protein RFI_18827 [Reticulomyxa filosa]|eukprot:ETO18438.1 hypothetical protein RFI_18827 [Reticulomyxa filosa]
MYELYSKKGEERAIFSSDLSVFGDMDMNELKGFLKDVDEENHALIHEYNANKKNSIAAAQGSDTATKIQIAIQDLDQHSGEEEKTNGPLTPPSPPTRPSVIPTTPTRPSVIPTTPTPSPISSPTPTPMPISKASKVKSKVKAKAKAKAKIKAKIKAKSKSKSKSKSRAKSKEKEKEKDKEEKEEEKERENERVDIMTKISEEPTITLEDQKTIEEKEEQKIEIQDDVIDIPSPQSPVIQVLPTSPFNPSTNENIHANVSENTNENEHENENQDQHCDQSEK